MKITIEIDSNNIHKVSDCIKICEVQDNGERIEYALSLPDLISALSESSKSNIGYTSELLPKNTVLYRDYGSSKEIFIDVPKMQRKINFEGFPFTVGFPRCIFQFKARKYTSNHEKWEIILEKVVAVKGRGPIKWNTELSSFPYSHVASTGDVCMGSNRLPSVKNINEIENFYTFFFSSPFGNDYGAKTTLNKDVATLFSDNFCEKDFDDNVLLSHKKTFSEFFSLQQTSN